MKKLNAVDILIVNLQITESLTDSWRNPNLFSTLHVYRPESDEVIVGNVSTLRFDIISERYIVLNIGTNS